MRGSNISGMFAISSYMVCSLQFDWVHVRVVVSLK